MPPLPHSDPGRQRGGRFSRRHSLAAAAVMATALTVRHPIAAFSQTPGATSEVDRLTGLIEIGDRSIYMERSGAGGPTVVLEAGLLSRSDVWSRDLRKPEGERKMVLPAVAGFTRIVTYDRPGTIGVVNLDPDGPLFHPSRSDPAPQPRTIQDIVADLHALSRAAKVPGPYVLVGHSVGGLCMRLFASTWPDEVAAMVLVDATHEDVWIEFERVLSPAAWDEFQRLTIENPGLLAAYPEAEQLWRVPLLDDPNVALMHQARAESPLQPMPLVVLSHGIPFAAPFPEWPTDQMERVMLTLQEDLAALVPNARHVIALQSGHDIHQDQPELVIEAIRQVVEAVRDPATLAALTATAMARRGVGP